MAEDGREVHWAPLAAVVVACGTCLSTLAAGLTGFAAGFVGVVWARWLPVVLLVGAVALWASGLVGPGRRRLRCRSAGAED